MAVLAADASAVSLSTSLARLEAEGRSAVIAQTVQPCDDQAPPDPPPSHDSNVAGWVLAAALLIVIVYDVWAVATHHKTISQWTKGKFSGHRWWRVLGMTVIGLTLAHLFFGGPLWNRKDKS
jgi:hypothetical protein